jgi:pyruvate formate lyase activating enzyme
MSAPQKPHEARYYEKLEHDTVRCHLCPHACVIQVDRRGICEVRENQGGRLIALSYGKAIAVHEDPIEKKPLFHVLPGSISLSVATVGCNLRCSHCQNYEISQYPHTNSRIPGDELSPEQLADAACQSGAQTISFTYTEPTIFMEWAQDCTAAAHGRGVRSVFVTNGYSAAQPIRDIQPHLAAANVDLKGFRDEFYQHTCKARLQPVLDTIKLMRELGIWVEVTTLLIPGLNDDPTELTQLAAFLASVDPSMPWHISRFHPDYHMLDRPATSQAAIASAREIGVQAGLQFIYAGNLPGDPAENTYCPSCHALLIERHGFRVLQNLLNQGRCPACHRPIPGIWS